MPTWMHRTKEAEASAKSRQLCDRHLEEQRMKYPAKKRRASPSPGAER